MEKVKILAVGIGGYANVYLEELLAKADPDYEFVGMIDIAAEQCKFYPRLRELGVPLFSSMEEFYESHRADLAIVTTPIHFHTRQILCALRHGSNVMCEKPLSGVSADEAVLEQAIRETGKFVIIGYQWSYAPPILDLKRDISAGVFGKAEFLKSLVFWPRPKEYFTRGSGWGGRIRTPEGDIINDSVVSNATAHYLHNMLYVTGGAPGKSQEAVSLDCALLRANTIENFDTATVRLTLADGTPALFVVSHATAETVDPTFEYRFEKGTVRFSSTDKQITATMADGTVRCYGNPFANINRKVFDAIAACRRPHYDPPCTVRTAAPQVRCVEKIQTFPIRQVPASRITETARDGGHFLSVNGLGDALLECYRKEILLSELPGWEGPVAP